MRTKGRLSKMIGMSFLALLSVVSISMLPAQASAASLVYDSFYYDLARGDIDIDSDTFGCMLVASSYAPNKGAHDRRNDIFGEVVATGYVSGGQICTLTIALDTTNHRIEISVVVPPWTGSTITSRGLVVYKRNGGASSADPLLYYVDFLSDITSTNSTFSFNLTTPFRIQN